MATKRQKHIDNNTETIAAERTVIHIVFQEADIKVLQDAIALDEALAGEVRIIKDDFAVGPIENVEEPEGYQERRAWWRQLVDFSPYNTDDVMNMVDDRLAIHQLKQHLQETEELDVWIWMGQNQHDVCGYYWLVSQLKEYAGRIKVIYLNNLPFINEKGQLFYPTTLHQIQPSEFLKAKKLARAITVSEFETDPDEWKRLCAENAEIRILEGGKKIVSQEANFYDTDILKGLSNEWQKGSRVMHQILGKMKVKTGDIYLLWRMKQLAANGDIEIKGNPAGGWKEFEVRLTPAAAEPIAEDREPS